MKQGDKYDKGYSDWKNEICVKLRYYVFEMGVDFNNNRSGWWVRLRVVSYECKLCEYYFYKARLVCTVSFYNILNYIILRRFFQHIYILNITNKIFEYNFHQCTKRVKCLKTRVRTVLFRQ